MRNYFIYLFILFSSIVHSQALLKAKVVGVKDGDTVVVLDSLNNQTTLRLAEIDCPEKNQPFGTKAKQFNSDQIYRKQIIYIVTDVDRYGRLIAMIYYDNGKYLSTELLKNGLAWHYKLYSNSIKFSNYEENSRINKVGLWIEYNPTPPWEWRKLKFKLLL